MTVLTSMEGITAPARAAGPALPSETFLPHDDVQPLASRRHDGWSAANQRLFLEAIAEGHGVDAACLRVGLSASSAYAFRRTAKGAAFALGWRAATLLARDCVAETLMVRALEGQVDTWVRADGHTVTRHRHDNGLALRLLARLDRQVESAPDADVKAARVVAQEFDAFLGLVERDEGAAHAGLFLARRCGVLADGERGAGDSAVAGPDLAPIHALAAADRLTRTGVATAGEIDIADLDPAERARWTGEQWRRAEAAGLLALAAPPTADPAADTPPASQHPQHSPGDPGTDHIWWDDKADDWRTDFPPPAGFWGIERGERDHVDYERALSDAERALLGPGPYLYDDAEQAALAAERDAHFAILAARATPSADPVPDPWPARHVDPHHDWRETS